MTPLQVHTTSGHVTYVVPGSSSFDLPGPRNHPKNRLNLPVANSLQKNKGPQMKVMGQAAVLVLIDLARQAADGAEGD